MIITFVGNFQVDYSSESHHKKTLEGMGHTVIPLQEGVATSVQIYNHAIKSDMLVWVHTHNWNTDQRRLSVADLFKRLKAGGIPTLTYHLDLWFGLERQKDLEGDPFYKNIEYFFTVDKKMASWFNENTEVKGLYLPAACFGPECYMTKALPEGEYYTDVAFVGSKGYHPEWQWRPQLIQWLRDIYGDRFLHVGGDGQTGTIRGNGLNEIYGDTKVAIGDSLCLNFSYPYYWSDRVYETLGRGGFMIHPYIKGMENHFEDKKHLVFFEFGNFDQLKDLIDYYIEHDKEREKIRKAGHEHVKENHTYKNRWEVIMTTVGKEI